jgi:valyl-tRNA synthetase
MSGKDLPKAYESGRYEDAIYAAWEQSGFFNPDNLPGNRPDPFTIVLPPPNVTGTLHMGHAVMLAIEDIMVRFARLRGKRTLWVPGTDHAAIATQAKVEKLLIASGLKDPRRELGREAFLKHVETFAAQSHDTIVNQVRRMGASIDWSREAYTLDAARNRAVNAVFKRMYDDGLIYRGNRVVNWCPRCLSTLADDEVEHKETTAKFYTFAYDRDFPIAISSTRPETKLGDTAVAVHPRDKRYKKFVGKTFDATFAGKRLSIRIVADESVDPEFGTGALGVTPSHSNTDADIAARHELPFETVIGEDGLMTENTGAFRGLPVKAAREKIIATLREQGLIQKEEEVAQNLSVCYRCSTAVEPLPKLQWFIDVDKPFAFRASQHAPIKGLKNGQKVTLKSVMQHVVKKGEIEILPERFDKTYFHWIDNLRDWNISRQLWFGHRVPVWYKGSEMTVGEAPSGGPDAAVGAGWEQDPDTLDTWFSAGLWTFSTLGWPEQTKDFEIHHPTSVLETGYDILFFWVARMILMTTYAVGEVPFKTVYLHGLVRDEQGRKMSKSLDNIIDPLDMIGKFGADATRLSLVIGSTPGNDMKLSEEKVAGYRNFTNKLWNVARFVLTTADLNAAGAEAKSLADRWIVSRFADVQTRVEAHLEAHELSAAGELLRDFTWTEFADWYLEIAKIEKNDGLLLQMLERLLILWHPFMPFVTEAIWKEWKGEKNMLMVAAWPKVLGKKDAKSERQFTAIQEIVTTIRNLRAQYRVEPGKFVNVLLVGDAAALAGSADIIKRLARVEDLQISASAVKPEDAASAVVGKTTIYLPLSGIMDVQKEKARLQKELDEARAYIQSLETKLENREFVGKAPAQVVEGMKSKLAEAREKAKTIEDQLSQL